jgi:hypothetical protein
MKNEEVINHKGAEITKKKEVINHKGTEITETYRGIRKKKTSPIPNPQSQLPTTHYPLADDIPSLYLDRVLKNSSPFVI